METQDVKNQASADKDLAEHLADKAPATISELLKSEDDGEMKSDIVIEEKLEQARPAVKGKAYEVLRRMKTSDGIFLPGEVIHESHTDFAQLMERGHLGEEIPELKK